MAETKQGEFFDEQEVMSAEERERYHSQKLAEMVGYAYHHAPSVRELFDRAGASPGEIRTVKDLERLPITRKTELIELQKSKPPYGGFLTIPPEEVNRVFIIPGPIYLPHLTENIKCFAKSFYAAGFTKGDIILNTFTFHMSPAGITMHDSIRSVGAVPIPMGTGNTEIQIQTMLDMKVTG